MSTTGDDLHHADIGRTSVLAFVLSFAYEVRAAVEGDTMHTTQIVIARGKAR